MFLKEIKFQGFKSFADKTSIELSNGITGIVGPNGSGKSNVVDAVRWVLGEQSVKQLRGDGNMADVIFSGSKSRSGMNRASVTLIFDNTDRYLPVAYDEVIIKRRVFRDGTNEYFLNNSRVRLKDIVNLLLDSGIAKESFNIISQGKIEEIISSKPNERRVIFEEAAGVLKYKRRKEEAIRKLDKTHINMERVNDIISELEPQIEPLRAEKEKANNYIKTKAELTDIEVALITEDITNINYSYQNNKNKIEELEKEILSLTSINSSSEAKTAKIKSQITMIDSKIADLQGEVLRLSTLSEKLNSRKAIVTERKAYEVDDNKLHDKLLDLKEKLLKVGNAINLNETDIINISKSNDELVLKENELSSLIGKQKKQREVFEGTLTKKLRNKSSLKIKEESLRDEIENNGLLPSGVKHVLNNPKLRGIHDVLGALIETEDKYAQAISVILGFNSNNIVVDDENCARDAIETIKNIGRATFFPLNVIKPKSIDKVTLDIINKEPYFIGVASDVVKCNDLYRNVVDNQFGNVLITESIDEAIRLSKKINYRYRIVSLDGEIIHVGGSITGGKRKRQRNIISEKYELENVVKLLAENDKAISNTENKLNEIDYELKALEDNLYLINRDKLLNHENIKSKQENIKKLKDEREKLEFDINSTNNLLGGVLSREEEKILEEYYETIKNRDERQKELSVLMKKKTDLNDVLDDYEASLRKDNSLYNDKTKELKSLEIDVNRMDVKLDNLLNLLSDTYEITYEKAKENYKLEMDYSLAKNKVSSLKRTLKELGVVNLAAPEEYERVSERYEFLVNQINDLKDAEDTLLKIISEMDKVMALNFSESFKAINANFTDTFKELFKGGNATLKLTDPDNLLETGIDIIASPPGKKLTSISLLSGGEKTLTAISLLFAIIKTRPAPFCILDEVEAALDEANVDTFGAYLTKLKSLSQFIIITHKKKTMEYTDVLYGITMQESGVSKLVSVKLEDA